MSADLEVQEGNTVVLPPVVDGEMATVISVDMAERKTKAPKRYKEATLIEDMEGAAKFIPDAELRSVMRIAKGMGTAATRHTTIDDLKEKKFIERKGQELVPTKLGEDLIDYLPPALYDVGTTARLELDLQIVEEKGGGAALEQRVAQEVQKLLAILKAHGPMTRSEAVTTTRNTQGERKSMSENGENQRSGPPTPKMLEYAEGIATKLKLRLPADVPDDFASCKAFIDEHKDAAAAIPQAPSPKQLSYAESIAKRKNLTIPDDALKSAKEISAWIDANK
jgi:hypothetical protein